MAANSSTPFFTAIYENFSVFRRVREYSRTIPGRLAIERLECASTPMLETPLHPLNDPEGPKVPDGLPPIIDAHVHLFPDGIFGAIHAWFDQYAWPIRYKMTADEAAKFLLSRGIDRIVGLHYAHKPGVARYLNGFMADLCRDCGRVTGTATVFPGEDDATAILEEGFRRGLKGVKLHGHVQAFRMDSDAMRQIYEVCSANGEPLVMHVGRAPMSPLFEYPADPYRLYSAEKLEEVIRAYPRLRVCVPHLGADEFAAYRRLLERYDNLWLDVAMTLADYLPGTESVVLASMRLDRVMYGTDFPNIPYAWDREIRRISGLGLPDHELAMILGANARDFFSIDAG
jgi:hypothetical protein